MNPSAWELKASHWLRQLAVTCCGHGHHFRKFEAGITFCECSACGHKWKELPL